jgi:hypothetical protein
MIAGYRRDLASDKAKGTYNPVGEGIWNADEMMASLRNSIKAVASEEMDSIVDVDAAASIWWEV